MNGFERYTKKTRREVFLEEMEQVVPWRELCGLIEPHYPKPGNGRPPVGVERMLRMYFLQQWFNLSDPAVEETLYDSPVMRQFVGIDLGEEPAPDETTVCKFRHLLEEHGLGEKILGTVNLHLQARGVRITTGTIVDATILHAPSSTKNREQQRDPEMHQTKKGNQWYFGMKAHVGVTARPRSSTRRWPRRPMLRTRRCWRICCMGKKPEYGGTRPIVDKLRLSRSAPPWRRTTLTVVRASRSARSPADAASGQRPSLRACSASVACSCVPSFTLPGERLLHFQLNRNTFRIQLINCPARRKLTLPSWPATGEAHRLLGG